ncbi:hypothetical protein HZU75_04355 [Chitinibacter fontanus]|uniref:Uncharacterized protein n=1 Tax=Chitinibacter fontanus TaxID=1737446 RepID=A0A7D5Z410_9NEIS|nr:hypothetical protein [Chitinibacter fontanus]QLI80823.1 hypothetical protein HZU75_04355 [Chitinibacter fontanus]
MNWIKRIYLILLRDLVAANFMATTQLLPRSAIKPNENETLGEAMARNSYRAADEFIKHRQKTLKK